MHEDSIYFLQTSDDVSVLFSIFYWWHKESRMERFIGYNKKSQINRDILLFISIHTEKYIYSDNQGNSFYFIFYDYQIYS